MTQARWHIALRRAYFALEHRRIAMLVNAIRQERRSEVRHLNMSTAYADKAEHYWGLMLTYYDLAKQAKSPAQSNSYRRVAIQCRAMAKEAFALVDAGSAPRPAVGNDAETWPCAPRAFASPAQQAATKSQP